MFLWCNDHFLLDQISFWFLQIFGVCVCVCVRAWPIRYIKKKNREADKFGILFWTLSPWQQNVTVYTPGSCQCVYSKHVRMSRSGRSSKGYRLPISGKRLVKVIWNLDIAKHTVHKMTGWSTMFPIWDDGNCHIDDTDCAGGQQIELLYG